MPENPARALEQKRAQDAWNIVRPIKQEWEAARNDQKVEAKVKKHSALARGAPADVLTAGLGQTLAFWRAKKEPHHLWLYDAVSTWVLDQMKLPGNAPDLLEWIVDTADANQYRMATAEALAYLTWVKRFAEAELPKGDSDD